MGQKWVKNACSKSYFGPFGVHKLVNCAHFEPVLTQFSPGCFLVWWGALSKNLAQSGLLGRGNLRTFLQLRVVRYLGVIFTPSEPLLFLDSLWMIAIIS